MEIILQQLLGASAAARRLHWTTKSFAKHVALQELYELLDKFVDQLAEEWMGKYGNDQTINNDVNQYKQTDVLEFINALFNDLESFKNLMPKDEWLVNTYEELQSKVSQVKYKLENLS